MLELHRGGQVPEAYRGLVPFLLTPPIWTQKGSIPGLVRLLSAFIEQDGEQMFASGQIASVLAVAQQRLIPSKLNDAWGFELLQTVISNIKPYVFYFFIDLHTNLLILKMSLVPISRNISNQYL